MIRRHKSPPEVKDIDQLPVVMSEHALHANVLARTTSGNLVTAPSSSVRPASSFTHESTGASAAAVPAPMVGAGSATKPGTPPAAPAAPANPSIMPSASSKPPTPATSAVSVNAAAGNGAAIVAAAAQTPEASPAAGKPPAFKAGQEPSSIEAGAPGVQELSLRQQALAHL
jgi:hypothetical protein